MAVPKLLVSAHLLCFINGRLVGETTGVQWDSATPHNRRMGLDSLTPYGFDPSSASVSGTLTLLRLHGTGALEGRGITAPFHKLPLQKFFAILIVDRITGKRVYQADHCVVTSQSWSNQARDRVVGRFTFEAIDWQNEAEYS